MDKYNDYSAWTSAPADLHSSLETDIKASVAIVGGGYLGLVAAITLAEQNVDVVILEQQFCGFGASGRNAGHLTPTIGRDLVYCLKTFGQKKGMALATFAEHAVRFTEELMQQYHIDCDYLACGNVVAGVHPSQRKSLLAAAETCQSAGLDMPFWDEAEVRERGLPRFVQFAQREPVGGLLHPGKYVMALRRLAIAKGVRIYEQTPVQRIEHGERVRVHTQGGTVLADKALLATNAFTAPTLGLMRNRVTPLRVTLFNTRPLTDAELAALDWRGREGIYTAHNLLENFRLTADNRISGGSKWVQYRWGSRLAEGNQPEVFAAFEMLFKERFPELPAVEIDTFWGGWIGTSLDMLPFVGVDKKYGNVHHCVGFNGHGIAQASRMGWVMAQQILGESREEVQLLQRRGIPLPPEPLRWLAVHAVRLGMSWKDRRVDRLLREAGRR